MPETESAKCVVVAGGADAANRNESGLLMTALTKLRGVMTIAAIRFASISRAWVAREKILRVVT